MFFRPFATYSSAVCQSTVFHSPPCLSIGAVRRLSSFSASYEKRSRSASQHSLTSSFSNGSTRRTLLFLTCTMKFAPVLSYGLTDLRRDSSHGHTKKQNNMLVSAPTGHRSIMLPETSLSTV